VLRDLTGGYGAPLALCMVLEIVAAMAVISNQKSGSSKLIPDH